MKIKKLIKNNIMYYVKDMVFVSPCRKVIIKLSIYFSFLFLALLICSIPQFLIHKNNLSPDHKTVRFPTDLKYILFWQPNLKRRYTYNHPQKLPEGQSVFIRQKCKYINCFITYNKDLLKEDHRNLDAVVFKIKEIMHLVPQNLNLTRSPSQIYIFQSLESSERSPICNSLYDNFFNWTWTYKLNSDIPQPFINIYDVNNKLIGPKKDINWTTKYEHNDRYKHKISRKSKAVAWILTKCGIKSKYSEFIREFTKELKSYNYTLNIFGSCGSRKCIGKSKNMDNCFKMIEKDYYFQLVLEDSFTEDYVSEKMVKAMTHIAIPIILGYSNYNSFLPPGSFINAQRFEMKKLGAIIDYLIRYPISYSYFFDWKNHYYYTARPRHQICDLCAKLNNHNITARKNTYYKFRQWWNPDYRDTCSHLQYHDVNFDKE